MQSAKRGTIVAASLRPCCTKVAPSEHVCFFVRAFFELAALCSLNLSISPYPLKQCLCCRCAACVLDCWCAIRLHPSPVPATLQCNQPRWVSLLFLFPRMNMMTRQCPCWPGTCLLPHSFDDHLPPNRALKLACHLAHNLRIQLYLYTATISSPRELHNLILMFHLILAVCKHFASDVASSDEPSHLIICARKSHDSLAQWPPFIYCFELQS